MFREKKKTTFGRKTSWSYRKKKRKKAKILREKAGRAVVFITSSLSISYVFTLLVDLIVLILELECNIRRTSIV
jgi:hypothetical protein